MSESIDYSDYYLTRQLTKSVPFLRHLFNKRITNIIKAAFDPPASGRQFDEFFHNTWGALIFEFDTNLAVSFIPDESVLSVVVRIEKLPDGKIVDVEDNYLSPTLFLINANDARLSNTRIAKIIGSQIRGFKIFRYAKLGQIERTFPDKYPCEHAIIFEFDNNLSLIYDLDSKSKFTDEVSEEYWETITPLLDIN